MNKRAIVSNIDEYFLDKNVGFFARAFCFWWGRGIIQILYVLVVYAVHKHVTFF